PRARTRGAPGAARAHLASGAGEHLLRLLHRLQRRRRRSGGRLAVRREPMSGDALMLLALCAPLAGAVLVLAMRRRANVREAMSLGAGVVLLAAVARLAWQVLDGDRPSLILVEPVPGATFHLAAEPLGAVFALVASFLWIVTTVYSIGYMRAHGESKQTRFYTFFAIAIASTMGVALSGNLLTLFFFYEVLTLSTYPLVAHAGSDEARRGARVYLAILIATSMGLFLVAIIGTALAAGSIEFTAGGVIGEQVSQGVAAVLLLLYVFGIGKAALMPFHRWLPSAMVAPTPVSA